MKCIKGKTAFKKYAAYLCIAVIVFLKSSSVFAQYENYNWTIGNKTGLNFNTQPASVFSTSIQAPFRSATVSDAAGNLLFYTNGIMVWDKNNNVMPNGDSITRINNSLIPDGSDAYIVPDPASNQRYYIFTAPTLSSQTEFGNSSVPTLRYSIVDMSLNGGLGDVLPGNKTKFLDSNVSNAIAVAGYGMCDKWLVAHMANSNQFRAYHITATGISAPVVSFAGDLMTTWIGMMKFANNNQKIALRSYETFLPCFIQLFDFDYATGKVSNPVLIDSLATFGVPNLVGGIGAGAIEFSPDNKKLYSGIVDSTKPNLRITNIYQYDLTLPTAAAVQGSKKMLGTIDSFSEMQLTPDGHIYISEGKQGGGFAVIPYPDKEVPACGLINNYVVAPQNPDTAFFYSGCMANLVPAAHLIYNYNDVYACQFPSVLKSQQSQAGSYLWNTGATTQSINITQPGTYWVKAGQSCNAWRVDTFHVLYLPPPPTINDTFSCNGQAVTITLNTQGGVVWSDSTTGTTFTVDKSGTYSVATTIGQCVYRDTFNVTVYPPSDISFIPSDTSICNSTMSAQITSSYNFGNYHWSTGDTTRTVTIDSPGVYWLTAATPCGIYSDTMIVRFCPPKIDSLTVTNDTICSGSCVQFTASVANNPSLYEWQFEGGNPSTFSGSPTPVVCYDSAGNFKARVRVSNHFGTDSAEINVVVLPKPVPRFRDTMIVIPYKSPLPLPACATAMNVNWYDQDNNLVCANCTDLNLVPKDWQKTYYCVVQNQDCSDTCFYKIQVTNIPSDAWLPDAFTPNGDGRNDYFHLITDNPNIKLADLVIYDRWGNNIYHAQQNGTGWDGTYNGKPAEMGVYFWYLRYWVLGNNGKYYEQKGDVTLIR